MPYDSSIKVFFPITEDSELVVDISKLLLSKNTELYSFTFELPSSLIPEPSLLVKVVLIMCAEPPVI